MHAQWGPIVAGAIAAAALALVLHSFALAIRLAVSWTAPTWRDASITLVVLSGLYVILAALAAYGLGGYVAGLLRSRATPAAPDDVEFRDGMHGLLVWALATLLVAVIGLATAQSLSRLAAPSGGAAGVSTSVGGENLIAYDLDRLFRAERRPNADLDYPRAEAAASCLRPPVIAACCRRIGPISCAWWPRRPDFRNLMPNVASTTSPRVPRRISLARARALSFSPSRRVRLHCLGLPPPGSPPAPAGACATANFHLMCCGIGGGRFDGPEHDCSRRSSRKKDEGNPGGLLSRRIVRHDCLSGNAQTLRLPRRGDSGSTGLREIDDNASGRPGLQVASDARHSKCDSEDAPRLGSPG